RARPARVANDTAPPGTDTLSLHAALPISRPGGRTRGAGSAGRGRGPRGVAGGTRARVGVGLASGGLAGEQFVGGPGRGRDRIVRSEEHTSELQSREKLVCRLLLEKKKRQR